MSKLPGDVVNRLYLDTLLSRMAAVFSAAKETEWNKVEVRRPLEAATSSECGPS